ncbi:hypothetical protein [Rhizobium leguminosarum]|nr:hypothetical protein [Rhizobium leguminosarum]
MSVRQADGVDEERNRQDRAAAAEQAKREANQCTADGPDAVLIEVQRHP